MKRLFIIMGLLLTLLFPRSLYASPYTDIVDTLKQELTLTSPEDIVKEFVRKIYPDVIDADILGALNNNIARVCNKEPTTPAKANSECTAFLKKIIDLVQQEEFVRSVGRELQTIVTGYELPVDGMPGRDLNFASRYQGIISIWQTGTDGNIANGGTDILVRSKPIDKNIMEPLLDTLKTQLLSLPKHDLAPTIWRYQHGLRFVRGGRISSFGIPPLLPFHREAPPTDPDNGLNTERQNLFRRWNGSNGTPNIEQALNAIWEALPKNPLDPAEFDPPLVPKEIVLFTFGKDFLKQHMPDNIVLWARIDGNPAAGWPWGDVGLTFDLPLEPSLPSLIGTVSKKAILGGRYPPDPSQQQKPIDGLGLCTHPFPAEGYLCRDRIAIPGEKCDETGQPPIQTNTITLMRCQQNANAPPQTTRFGPDVCTDINWQMSNANVGRASSARSASSRPVCDPENQILYRNTIGNNACYIGTCIEGSLELHRLTSGRNSFVTQDEAYLWDGYTRPDPIRTSLLTMPPIAQAKIPRYRPQLLLQVLDSALCQKNGLPPRTPPALCLFNVRRALSYPGQDYDPLVRRLLQQSAEHDAPTAGLENLGTAIGSRISTSLFSNYLRTTTRSLADIIGVANTLLSSIKKTAFPQVMCHFGTP